jgi:hypothetical protein
MFISRAQLILGIFNGDYPTSASSSAAYYMSQAAVVKQDVNKGRGCSSKNHRRPGEPEHGVKLAANQIARGSHAERRRPIVSLRALD